MYPVPTQQSNPWLALAAGLAQGAERMALRRDEQEQQRKLLEEQRKAQEEAYKRQEAAQKIQWISGRLSSDLEAARKIALDPALTDVERQSAAAEAQRIEKLLNQDPTNLLNLNWEQISSGVSPLYAAVGSAAAAKEKAKARGEQITKGVTNLSAVLQTVPNVPGRATLLAKLAAVDPAKITDEEYAALKDEVAKTSGFDVSLVDLLNKNDPDLFDQLNAKGYIQRDANGNVVTDEKTGEALLTDAGRQALAPIAGLATFRTGYKGWQKKEADSSLNFLNQNNAALRVYGAQDKEFVDALDQIQSGKITDPNTIKQTYAKGQGFLAKGAGLAEVEKIQDGLANVGVTVPAGSELEKLIQGIQNGDLSLIPQAKQQARDLVAQTAVLNKNQQLAAAMLPSMKQEVQGVARYLPENMQQQAAQALAEPDPVKQLEAFRTIVSSPDYTAALKRSTETALSVEQLKIDELRDASYDRHLVKAKDFAAVWDADSSNWNTYKETLLKAFGGKDNPDAEAKATSIVAFGQALAKKRKTGESLQTVATAYDMASKMRPQDWDALPADVRAELGDPIIKIGKAASQQRLQLQQLGLSKDFMDIFSGPPSMFKDGKPLDQKSFDALVEQRLKYIQDNAKQYGLDPNDLASIRGSLRSSYQNAYNAAVTEYNYKQRNLGQQDKSLDLQQRSLDQGDKRFAWQMEMDKSQLGLQQANLRLALAKFKRDEARADQQSLRDNFQYLQNIRSNVQAEARLQLNAIAEQRNALGCGKQIGPMAGECGALASQAQGIMQGLAEDFSQLDTMMSDLGKKIGINYVPSSQKPQGVVPLNAGQRSAISKLINEDTRARDAMLLVLRAQDNSLNGILSVEEDNAAQGAMAYLASKGVTLPMVQALYADPLYVPLPPGAGGKGGQPATNTPQGSNGQPTTLPSNNPASVPQPQSTPPNLPQGGYYDQKTGTYKNAQGQTILYDQFTKTWRAAGK